MRPSASQLALLVILGIIANLAGCASFRGHSKAEPLELCPSSAAQAGMTAAVGRHTDAWFAVCAQAWQELALYSDSERDARRETYNDSVWELLAAACREGRIDPVGGLRIHSSGRWIQVPIRYVGFAWKPQDFQRLYPPPCHDDRQLQRRYGCAGVGFPVVVERARRDCDPIEARFFPEKSYFAATPVLEFSERGAAQLSFYDPFHSPRRHAPDPSIAADYSAHLALAAEKAPRSYFAGFIEPGGDTVRPRLNLLEPYQAGKVPVVVIHGLFSDPLSWVDLVNDLRASPGFADRFQIWAFRYPTGRGFLQSATALRAELAAAIATLDPEQTDPALSRMVLIGHSMGGLIAKLQVTYSDELIWNELANQPLESIVTTEQTRTLLADNCYFDPSPHIGRVIFIATPHSGSTYSSGLVGKGASLLVEPAQEQANQHEQLIRDNPGVFNRQFERRLPTSIDMLAPQSLLLGAMKQMRFKQNLTLHNILGVAHPLSTDGPTDGVVSVGSAKHPGCQSVLAFNAQHAKIHRELRTSHEVLRILKLHLEEL